MVSARKNLPAASEEFRHPVRELYSEVKNQLSHSVQHGHRLLVRVHRKDAASVLRVHISAEQVSCLDSFPAAGSFNTVA